MRIISKFHDYYDKGLSYGSDPKVIYMRTTEVFKEKIPDGIYPLKNSSRYLNWNREFEIYPLTICFCGRTYQTCQIITNTGDNEYYYSAIEVENYIKTQCSQKQYKQYYCEKNIYSQHSKKLVSYRDIVNRCFEHDYEQKYIDLFHKYNTPIFYFRKSKEVFSQQCIEEIVINPRLSDFKFYKTLQVNNAFQELAVFVGGILALEGKNIPAVSDEDMITAKGFDKYSFRKEPSSGKRR